MLCSKQHFRHNKFNHSCKCLLVFFLFIQLLWGMLVKTKLILHFPPHYLLAIFVYVCVCVKMKLFLKLTATCLSIQVRELKKKRVNEFICKNSDCSVSRPTSIAYHGPRERCNVARPTSHGAIKGVLCRPVWLNG